MKNLISIVVLGLLFAGCNHHDRKKAVVYYVYPEPLEVEDETEDEGEDETEELACEEHDDHHHKHKHHKHHKHK